MSGEMNKVIEDNNTSDDGSVKISRDLLVLFIKGLNTESNGESFITPILAKKVIDYVYLLKNRKSVDSDAADSIIRTWYRASPGERSVTPFNQRTKNVEEVMELLEKDYQVNDIIKP